MLSLYKLIDAIINLYWWCLIVYVVLSWLIAFNVVNTYNKFVNGVGGFLHRVIEPVLKPIRRIVPSLGGVDLAPLILLLLIFFVRNLLWEYWGSQIMRTG
ncbi:MAG: YggT family protein [Alphaproteobacteria bacterium]